MFHSDILIWIAQLRTRVERNELAGHRLIDFGYGTTVPAERAVRTMLDTLRELDGRRAGIDRVAPGEGGQRSAGSGDEGLLRRKPRIR